MTPARFTQLQARLEFNHKRHSVSIESLTEWLPGMYVVIYSCLPLDAVSGTPVILRLSTFAFLSGGEAREITGIVLGQRELLP